MNRNKKNSAENSAGSLSEGCTDLLTSLEGVRMTAEGIFIIEEQGPADPAVSLYSCVPNVASPSPVSTAGCETLKGPFLYPSLDLCLVSLSPV